MNKVSYFLTIIKQMQLIASNDNMIKSYCKKETAKEHTSKKLLGGFNHHLGTLVKRHI